MLGKHRLRRSMLRRPLEPADPAEDLIAAQQGQMETLSMIIERQAQTIEAARHLMNVLCLRSESGPVFKLREDSADPLNDDHVSMCLLSHAVLDLQAKLEGTEPPGFSFIAETN